MKFKYQNINIVVEQNVIDLFNTFRQTGKKPESGGILLGEIYDSEVRIKKASVPTSFDSSSRYMFNRNKKSAQLITDYEFKNSGGTIIYIGEWHTHPENIPTPSSTDIKMITTQFRKNKINETFLLMIIVGLKDVYLGVYNGKILTPLSRED
jgi:integrative and conjugative element protein (TIGR02256 family)